MKVLFVSPEVAPIARAGGLGDVVGALPIALQRLGIDVRILCPNYKTRKYTLQKIEITLKLSWK